MKKFNLSAEEAENLLKKGISISSKLTKTYGHFEDERYRDKLWDDKRCYTSMIHRPRDYKNPIIKGIWIGDSKVYYQSDAAYQIGGWIQSPDYGGYYELTIKNSNEIKTQKIKGFDMQFYREIGLVKYLPPNINAENHKNHNWFIEEFYQSLNKENKELLLNNQYNK